MQLQNSKKITYLSLMVALSLIFSYVEMLLPINFGIPGVKLGLANVVSVVSLYIFGFGYTLIVVIARVILSGLLFGNMFAIIYSIAGGVISLIVMELLKGTDKFSKIGVSIAGGVFHNIGQLMIAAIVVKQIKLYFYGPILIASGIIMGAIIGIICIYLIKRVETYVRLC